MKTLSVKNLKKATRTLCRYKAAGHHFSDTTTTGDPTNTTITLTTTTHRVR